MILPVKKTSLRVIRAASVHSKAALWLFFAVGVSLSTLTFAQHQNEKKKRTPLTTPQAARQAQKIYGGKVLSVTQTGRNAYQVKLLQPNGRVKVVIIPTR